MKTTSLLKNIGGLFTAMAVLVACGSSGAPTGPGPNFNTVDGKWELLSPSSSAQACNSPTIALQIPRLFRNAINQNNLLDKISITPSGNSGANAQIVPSTFYIANDGTTSTIRFQANLSYGNGYILKAQALTAVDGGTTYTLESRDFTFTTADNASSQDYCAGNFSIVDDSSLTEFYASNFLDMGQVDSDGNIQLPSGDSLEAIVSQILSGVISQLIGLNPVVRYNYFWLEANRQVRADSVPLNIAAFKVGISGFTVQQVERIQDFSIDACYNDQGNAAPCVRLSSSNQSEIQVMAPGSAYYGDPEGSWCQYADVDASSVRILIMAFPSLRSTDGRILGQEEFTLFTVNGC